MIPVCNPMLGGNEQKYVNDCLQTNWISSSGKYVKAFEEGFSAYCGARHGIAVTSGTTALHLALAALKIGPGDEVILPAFTIASCAFAVLYQGATPVFVDVEPDTWNMDPRLVEEKVNRRTRAVMPVHIYGHPCDMDAIRAVARRRKLRVIEDAAEAHGAEYKGQRAGGIGDIGCFSFYANKIITCGEGGMVVTNDAQIAERCRSLKNLNFLTQKRFWHQDVGFNYRMTNIQAAIGLAQFERAAEFVANRRRNAQLYQERLKDIPGLVLPVEKDYAKNVYWMYGLLVTREFGMNREQIMANLREMGIETRTFFYALPGQPFLRKAGVKAGGRFPAARRIAREGMYLPSGSDLTVTQIDQVCEALRRLRKGR